MLFDGSYQGIQPDQRRTFAAFEILHTAVDFLAAIAFMIGSILFLYESLKPLATWFFIIGSALFGLKPTIRLFREIKLAARGRVKQLADKL
ncbi:MAG: YrhK family protein [Planctomycetota bacterium]|jgi:uncharacterized membrane protein YgdD (TMEM256/DUF423 family)|nr:YrhK family protein [Planctomycetota bacterium]